MAYTGQILSQLPGNNRSRALNQLGGVQFAAPIRGVLPMGPNGVPGFDTLFPLQQFDVHALARSATYNYTLGLQGIDTHLTCHYDTRSPISLTEVLEGVFLTTGSCPNGIDALDNPRYLSILSNHTLGFWACGLGDRNLADNSFHSYNIYLRGFRQLNTTVANITCVIETKPAEYSVTFLKKSSAFITHLSSSQSTTGFPTHLIKQSVQAIGSVVSESQGFATNSLAESVLALGAKLFGLPLGTRDDKYPKLFEYMIQGMVEYQVGDHLKVYASMRAWIDLCFCDFKATYTRLIETAHNKSQPAPASCRRPVHGNLTYQVVGWHYNRNTIQALIPPTLINLASFVLLLVAMLIGDKVLYDMDPTDLRTFLLSPVDGNQYTQRVKVDLDSQRIYSPTTRK